MKTINKPLLVPLPWYLFFDNKKRYDKGFVEYHKDIPFVYLMNK